MAATVVSCSKKEDTVNVSKGNLVGTWEVYKEIDKEDGEMDVDDEWGSNYGLIWAFEFRSDNTGVETWKDHYDGTWYTDEYYFTYTLNGNTLRIKYYDEDEYYYENYTIEKLTSNQLVLTWKDGGYSETYYLKRI